MRRTPTAGLQGALRLAEQPQYLPCADCVALPSCGGHELPLMRAFGCTRKLTDGREVDSDDMNPLDDRRFWELWNDVDGLLDFQVGQIRGVDSRALPPYVPVIQHEGSRSCPPEAGVVAIPLFQILRNRRDGSYGSRFLDGAALRSRFNLRPEAGIVLRGVDDDRKLERFWQHAWKNGVGTEIAKLGVIGVTVPNFSFFTDATRFQLLRNRKRIVLTAERLSAAGVNVIPHLNALSRSDWEFWADFLRGHPEIVVVAKEFQTGLKGSEEGGRAYHELVELQEKLGRPIHPFLVAGSRFYQDACRDFPHGFTVSDSTAFMGALARQVLHNDGGRRRWVKRPTKLGAPVDEHFNQNVRERERSMKANSVGEKQTRVPADVEGQMVWEDVVANPYLTPQPFAPGISSMQDGAKFVAHSAELIHSPALGSKT